MSIRTSHSGPAAELIDGASGTGTYSGDDVDWTTSPIGIPPTAETLDAELVGDGSSSVFTIDSAYVSGTLIVFVAGINVNDDLTETDPATGVFTLAFVPELGERITVLGR